MCVCVCVCEERERDRECVCVRGCMSVVNSSAHKDYHLIMSIAIIATQRVILCKFSSFSN